MRALWPTIFQRASGLSGRWKQIAYLLGALLALTVLLSVATFTPYRTYRSASDNPLELASADFPLQTAGDFLDSLGYLPAPTSLQSGCFDVDSSQVVGFSATRGPARKITTITFTTARVSSTESLLRSVLDDDPTYQAVIEALVHTAEGQETPVTIVLWEYGLLTPWAIYPSGDGWKVDRLCLNERILYTFSHPARMAATTASVRLLAASFVIKFSTW
jgi:hypothetical protein